jgi:hypothetical protein
MGTVSTKSATVVFFETHKLKYDHLNSEACIRCFTSMNSFIEGNSNCMTFRQNARFFSTRY